MAKELEVTLTGDDQTVKAFQSLIKSNKKAAKSSIKLLKVWRDLTIVFTGAKRLIGSVGRAIGAVAASSERQAKAEIAVAVGLARTEKNTMGALRELRKWNAAMQEATGIGDEFLFELQAIGVNLGRMASGQLKDATLAALDFATATGTDARTGMTQLSKLLATGRADFGRMGISVDTTKGAVAAFNEAVGKMQSGLAEAVGTLPIIQLKKFKNALGDLGESLGFLISATGTWKVVLGSLTGGVGKLADLLRDPEFVKTWGKRFDEFVVGTLEIATAVVGGFMRAMQALLNIFTKVGIALNLITWEDFAPPGIKAAAEALTTTMKSLRGEMARIQRQIKDNGDTTGKLAEKHRKLGAELSLAADQYGLLSRAAEKATGVLGVQADKMDASVGRFKKSVEDAGITTLDDVMTRVIAKAKAFWKAFAAGSEEVPPRFSASMLEVFDTLAVRIGEDKNLLGEVVRDDRVEEINARMEEIGLGWSSILASSMAQGIEESDSISGVFKNMGETARLTFMDQMSQEAFAPMKKTFGLLAQTLALPFKIVGTVVNDLILQPIAEFATKILSDMLKGLVKIFIASKTQQAAGAAAFGAAAAAFTPLLIQLSAGAVAAAIASFGLATSFAPAALVAIKSGALAGAIGYEEGGLQFPTGSRAGKLVRVAEREPEFIIGASQAGDFARRFGGGGGGDINVNIDTLSPDASVDDIQDLVDRVVEVFEGRIAELSAGGSRV